MIFSRKKKELWRYASENMKFAAIADGTNNQPLQPHHHQLQRLPQQLQSQQQNQQSVQLPENCCINVNSSPAMLTMQQNSHQQLNTPPPPYSSVPYGMDCSGSSEAHVDYLRSFRQQPQYTTDAETEMSVSATESEEQLACMSTTGYKYESYGDNMSVDINEQSDSSNNCQLPTSNQQQQIQRTMPSNQASAISSTVTTIATTASNLVRNCCGGVFFSDSVSDAPCRNNNNNSTNSMKTRQEQRQRMVTGTLTKKAAITPKKTTEQYFNALWKNLKSSQISALLTAVESRLDQSINSSVARKGTNVHQQCILVKRGLILDEEPYVIVSRLFLWRDLRDASELKRLPVCPTECDQVYVCCNPLHWCRIIELDTAPPPYQPHLTERLKTQDCVVDENSQNGKNICNTSTGSTISNIMKMQPELRVRIPESLTTDGEDQSARSLIWCQVAYWEMSQRVGERYLAKKSSINIYSDDPCKNDRSDDMCLKELAKEKRTKSSENVIKTRLKIGLGVTLSKENGSVWLYNRSMIPIFVHSPTLSESWLCICKIMPGGCLKAFDSERAQTLKYPSQFVGAQIGPIDTYRMQISFAKGWGNTYKRQDITNCPCWLEVLFPPQR